MSVAAKKRSKISFEEGMLELTNMVDSMQNGNLPLDVMMQTYENGMALAAQLEEMLTAHRRRIEQIDMETSEITEFKGEAHDIS